MGIVQKKFTNRAIVLILHAGFISLSMPAQTQNELPHEVGVVYYAAGSEFKALTKETDSEGGWSGYSVRIRGAHADPRLSAGQFQIFRMCGVDPSRFKLYIFKSSGNSRTLSVTKYNMFIGGGKSTVSKSEIPLTIETADGSCFKLASKAALVAGEYGFSPIGSNDAFMFGVGEVKKSK